MLIKDGAGNPFTYWPISGLVAGHSTPVIQFTVTAVDPTASIVCNTSSLAKVWVRKSGVGSYVNIAATPLALTGLSGDQVFDMYVEALGPTTELARVALTVGVGSGASAGWNS